MRQRERKQRNLRWGHFLVQPAVGAGHVHPCFEQLGGHAMGTRARVLVHEAPRVGDQADVQRLRDRRRGCHAELAHEVPHDFRGARGAGIDVVERAEARVVVVVVEVQQVRAVA